MSEGRDPGWLDVAAARVAGVEGVHLLDRSSDPDHHRSVFTLVGPSRPLVRAVFELASAACDAVDLARQGGVHPRVGALDVAPFVPLGGAPMGAAVEAARALGRRIGERLGVPVFHYGAAATDPRRERLEAIRRGGLAGLRARMERSRDRWTPDWGPSRPHPTAGVSAVGARDFLLAFNLRLDTDDLEAARRIARAVRASSGGLPTVKAIGVLLASQGAAQVSLNLTDFRRVSPLEAFERVEREARTLGVSIVASERIGLFPRAALAGVDLDAILLENPDPEGSLDDRLERLGISV